MATNDGGPYRARVVDNADPLAQSRLRVLVTDPVWALPSLPPGDARVPAIDEEVWIIFEGGDAASPVWESSPAAPSGDDATSGYVGVFRGVVVDNADPRQQHRLQVVVPEVAETIPMWATPGSSLTVDADPLPAVGADVWVEFEHGDPAYPVWVGVR